MATSSRSTCRPWGSRPPTPHGAHASRAHPRTTPLHRISVGDPAGTTYYISEHTGKPTMKTNRRGRTLGYVSAVLHWNDPA